MKTILSILLGLAAFSFVQAAEARTCRVTFEKCDFIVNGGCVKWNSKSIRIHRSEARYICSDLRRQYQRVRNCNTRDCGRQNPPPRRGLYWQMEGYRGEVLRRFGYGSEARRACYRDLERLQCYQDRRRRAICVGLRNNRVEDRFGPLRCRR